MGDNRGAVTEALRIRRRIAALDWVALRDALDADGYARLPSLLTASECRALAQLYGAEPNFRTTISLEGYRFGQGERSEERRVRKEGRSRWSTYH